MKGQLLICGLGIDRPRDVTLGTIEALKSCDVLFYIHGDAAALKPFLAAFCPDVRTFVDPAFFSLNDRARIKRVGAMIFKLLDRGRRVGYVTYGHPLLFSDGVEMARQCRQQGHRYQVHVAASSIDNILVEMHAQGMLITESFLTCHAAKALASLDHSIVKHTLILMGLDKILAGRKFELICARLRSLYPGRHSLYGIKIQDTFGETACVKIPVGEMLDFRPKIRHMMSLIIPPLRKRRPAGRQGRASS